MTYVPVGYYQSEHWQAVRIRFLTSRLWKGGCAACGLRVSSPHIHHRTYTRVGAERLHDLVGLCESCHDWTHHLMRGRRQRELWGVTGHVIKARRWPKSPYRSPNARKAIA